MELSCHGGQEIEVNSVSDVSDFLIFFLINDIDNLTF
jgi:hypothetical protein